MKYEIGDFVSKPVTGICKIEDILYLNPQDERNNKLYYLMKPIEDEKEKIYVPVSNADSRLRLCMTKKMAWSLIKRIPEIPTAWVNNEKMREQNYKEAVKANEPEALVSIIKMIYQRNQKRLAQGKNVPQRMQDIFRQQRIYYIWNWEWHLENQSRKYVKQLSSILTRANCELVTT